MIYLMGQAVLWFEGLGPLFLFSPWKHAGSRMFAAFGIAALHFGFGFTMRYALCTSSQVKLRFSPHCVCITKETDSFELTA